MGSFFRLQTLFSLKDSDDLPAEISGAVTLVRCCTTVHYDVFCVAFSTNWLVVDHYERVGLGGGDEKERRTFHTRLFFHLPEKSAVPVALDIAEEGDRLLFATISNELFLLDLAGAFDAFLHTPPSAHTLHRDQGGLGGCPGKRKGGEWKRPDLTGVLSASTGFAPWLVHIDAPSLSRDPTGVSSCVWWTPADFSEGSPHAAALLESSAMRLRGVEMVGGQREGYRSSGFGILGTLDGLLLVVDMDESKETASLRLQRGVVGLSLCAEKSANKLWLVIETTGTAIVSEEGGGDSDAKTLLLLLSAGVGSAGVSLQQARVSWVEGGAVATAVDGGGRFLGTPPFEPRPLFLSTDGGGTGGEGKGEGEEQEVVGGRGGRRQATAPQRKLRLMTVSVQQGRAQGGGSCPALASLLSETIHQTEDLPLPPPLPPCPVNDKEKKGQKGPSADIRRTASGVGDQKAATLKAHPLATSPDIPSHLPETRPRPLIPTPMSEEDTERKSNGETLRESSQTAASTSSRAVGFSAPAAPSFLGLTSVTAPTSSPSLFLSLLLFLPSLPELALARVLASLPLSDNRNATLGGPPSRSLSTLSNAGALQSATELKVTSLRGSWLMVTSLEKPKTQKKPESKKGDTEKVKNKSGEGQMASVLRLFTARPSFCSPSRPSPPAPPPPSSAAGPRPRGLLGGSFAQRSQDLLSCEEEEEEEDNTEAEEGEEGPSGITGRGGEGSNFLLQELELPIPHGGNLRVIGHAPVATAGLFLTPPQPSNSPSFFKEKTKSPPCQQEDEEDNEEAKIRKERRSIRLPAEGRQREREREHRGDLGGGERERDKLVSGSLSTFALLWTSDSLFGLTACPRDLKEGAERAALLSASARVASECAEGLDSPSVGLSSSFAPSPVPLLGDDRGFGASGSPSAIGVLRGEGTEQGVQPAADSRNPLFASEKGEEKEGRGQVVGTGVGGNLGRLGGQWKFLQSEEETEKEKETGKEGGIKKKGGQLPVLEMQRELPLLCWALEADFDSVLLSAALRFLRTGRCPARLRPSLEENLAAAGVGGDSAEDPGSRGGSRGGSSYLHSRLLRTGGNQRAKGKGDANTAAPVDEFLVRRAAIEMLAAVSPPSLPLSRLLQMLCVPRPPSFPLLLPFRQGAARTAPPQRFRGLPPLPIALAHPLFAPTLLSALTCRWKDREDVSAPVRLWYLQTLTLLLSCARGLELAICMVETAAAPKEAEAEENPPSVLTPPPATGGVQLGSPSQTGQTSSCLVEETEEAAAEKGEKSTIEPKEGHIIEGTVECLPREIVTSENPVITTAEAPDASQLPEAPVESDSAGAPAEPLMSVQPKAEKKKKLFDDSDEDDANEWESLFAASKAKEKAKAAAATPHHLMGHAKQTVVSVPNPPPPSSLFGPESTPPTRISHSLLPSSQTQASLFSPTIPSQPPKNVLPLRPSLFEEEEEPDRGALDANKSSATLQRPLSSPPKPPLSPTAAGRTKAPSPLVHKERRQSLFGETPPLPLAHPLPTASSRPLSRRSATRSATAKEKAKAAAATPHHLMGHAKQTVVSVPNPPPPSSLFGPESTPPTRISHSLLPSSQTQASLFSPTIPSQPPKNVLPLRPSLFEEEEEPDRGALDANKSSATLQRPLSSPPKPPLSPTAAGRTKAPSPLVHKERRQSLFGETPPLPLAHPLPTASSRPLSRRSATRSATVSVSRDRRKKKASADSSSSLSGSSSNEEEAGETAPRGGEGEDPLTESLPPPLGPFDVASVLPQFSPPLLPLSFLRWCCDTGLKAYYWDADLSVSGAREGGAGSDDSPDERAWRSRVASSGKETGRRRGLNRLGDLVAWVDEEWVVWRQQQMSSESDRKRKGLPGVSSKDGSVPVSQREVNEYVEELRVSWRECSEALERMRSIATAAKKRRRTKGRHGNRAGNGLPPFAALTGVKMFGDENVSGEGREKKGRGKGRGKRKTEVHEGDEESSECRASGSGSSRRVLFIHSPTPSESNTEKSREQKAAASSSVSPSASADRSGVSVSLSPPAGSKFRVRKTRHRKARGARHSPSPRVRLLGGSESAHTSDDGKREKEAASEESADRESGSESDRLGLHAHSSSTDSEDVGGTEEVEEKSEEAGEGKEKEEKEEDQREASFACPPLRVFHDCVTLSSSLLTRLLPQSPRTNTQTSPVEKLPASNLEGQHSDSPIASRLAVLLAAQPCVSVLLGLDVSASGKGDMHKRSADKPGGAQHLPPKFPSLKDSLRAACRLAVLLLAGFSLEELSHSSNPGGQSREGVGGRSPLSAGLVSLDGGSRTSKEQEGEEEGKGNMGRENVYQDEREIGCLLLLQLFWSALTRFNMNLLPLPPHGHTSAHLPFPFRVGREEEEEGIVEGSGDTFGKGAGGDEEFEPPHERVGTGGQISVSLHGLSEESEGRVASLMDTFGECLDTNRSLESGSGHGGSMSEGSLAFQVFSVAWGAVRELEKKGFGGPSSQTEETPGCAAGWAGDQIGFGSTTRPRMFFFWHEIRVCLLVLFLRSLRLVSVFSARGKELGVSVCAGMKLRRQTDGEGRNDWNLNIKLPSASLGCLSPASQPVDEFSWKGRENGGEIQERKRHRIGDTIGRLERMDREMKLALRLFEKSVENSRKKESAPTRQAGKDAGDRPKNDWKGRYRETSVGFHRGRAIEEEETDTDVYSDLTSSIACRFERLLTACQVEAGGSKVSDNSKEEGSNLWKKLICASPLPVHLPHLETKGKYTDRDLVVSSADRERERSGFHQQKETSPLLHAVFSEAVRAYPRISLDLPWSPRFRLSLGPCSRK
uniref:Uncharacterized protein n=1 Tax=Chromera velia CCMP2878 TaxID=1169474 RepID=A0A0G4ICE8_9ALVE|eukprot:Cvel_13002.t1-p1 / transcript=Cvel_13002.t1 / gene=Cvel_13002 / organism=Chromera_velia_CCMP2878 / gene_product=hypothetical protein / transcript_product=hypothetical protein / location=Cvel_scaffold872:13204-24054(-) / protein_length=2796 / sequence_SO=supercontig / SO=protein_coding / is_pseudo=false